MVSLPQFIDGTRLTAALLRSDIRLIVALLHFSSDIRLTVAIRAKGQQGHKVVKQIWLPRAANIQVACLHLSNFLSPR